MNQNIGIKIVTKKIKYPGPGHYCNVINQYLPMAVNSSQPIVYCVIIIYYYYFQSQLRRLRLCMEEEEEYEDELN